MRYRSRIFPKIEELEQRCTPTVHGTLNGTTLTVTADAANDRAAVRVSGADVLVVDDAANVTVFSTASANVQGISATANIQAGQSLSLEGVLILPGGVRAGGWARIQQSGSYNVSTGGYEADASESIALTPGAGVSTTDGDISLNANMQSTPSAGDFVGIDVNGATITATGPATIALNGRGGDDPATSNHVGVHLHGGAIVSSTYVPPPIFVTPGMTIPDRFGYRPGTVMPLALPAGGVMSQVIIQAINITGTGGKGSGSDIGVLIEDVGTTVSSQGVYVGITGNGGQSSAGGETGVAIWNGAGLDNVWMNGTGGSGDSHNDGIDVVNASASGSLTGQGGNGNGGANIGVLFTNGAQYQGGYLVGNGGTGNGNGNIGVLFTDGAQARAPEHFIYISGTGGGTASDFNQGVLLENNVGVTSKGCTVSIYAVAGAGSDSEAFQADQRTSITAYSIFIGADTMLFAANLSATTTVELSPESFGWSIVLGATGGKRLLGLSEAELHLVTADVLSIATNVSGLTFGADIIIATPITQAGTGYQKLSLDAGGAIRSLMSSTTTAVTANTLSLHAAYGMSLTISASNLSANNEYQGSIDIFDTVAVTILAPFNRNEPGLSTAYGGSITLEDASSILVDGIVSTEGGGDVNLAVDWQGPVGNGLTFTPQGGIWATTVTLKVAGPLIGSHGAYQEINATNLSIDCTGAVGTSAEPLLSAVAVLAVKAHGGLHINNAGHLTVGTVGGISGIVLPAGDIILSTYGLYDNTLLIDGLVLTGSGTVSLMAHRLANASSLGDLTLYPGMTVRSLAGNVILSAADGLTVQAGSAVLAINGNLTLAGGQENPSGGSVVLDGYVGATGDMLVGGGAGNDAFTLNPASGSGPVLAVLGNGGADTYNVFPSRGTEFYLVGGAAVNVNLDGATNPVTHLIQTANGLDGSITFDDFEQIVLNSVGELSLS